MYVNAQQAYLYNDHRSSIDFNRPGQCQCTVGTLSMAGSVFHEIPIKLYNGIHITSICPQVVYNLLWHTCMSPGVTDKRKFDEKL